MANCTGLGMPDESWKRLATGSVPHATYAGSTGRTSDAVIATLDVSSPDTAIGMALTTKCARL